jgi:hypothetical protein
VPALPELEQPQSIWATHVKPAPQSVAVLQGSSYLGLHDLVTTGTQSAGGKSSGCGALQSVPGGHGAGAASAVAVQPLTSLTHTVFSEQSRSSVHGLGTQPYPIVSMHIESQFVPGAQAMSGQARAVIASQW